jgi:sugar lactone lactonase YvrE
MISRWPRAIPIAATMSLIGLTVITGASVTASAAPKFTVVASGFDNPRGLAIGNEGKVLVAEAGIGGPTCVSQGGGSPLCLGLTSAISVITGGGSHHRVVSGLASTSDPGGIGATGLDGLSVDPNGGLYGIIASCPQQVAQVPPGTFPDATTDTFEAQAGQEIKVTGHGKFDTVAPVGRADWEWSQDHVSLVPDQFPDCNPYGILAQKNGQWVVDAASNTIDHVTNGQVDVEKLVPNPQSSDAVPTCIAQGPDGALYVSQLTGGGNPAGSANVWRFDPQSEDLDVWASGLTAVTGCGFGPDGQFYATEFSQQPFENFAPSTGALVRVPPHSTSPVVVADGLSFPNGFAASGNSIYVSNWSVCPGSPPQHGPCAGHPGEVVKVTVNQQQGNHDDDD